ncbi:MAG: radical SAM protein [PVC group bacterium]|nr:radical SAM protein [PVC group bacterium]
MNASINDTSGIRCFLLVPPEEKTKKDNEVGQEGIFPPLGLAYLAAVLRNNNIQVKIFDALASRLSMEDVCEIIQREKPDFCGITVLSQQIKAVQKLVAKLKIISPSTKIVLGGPHIHFEHENVIIDSNVDFCVRGEGEETVLELIQAVNKKTDLRVVKGIVFKDENNKVVINEQRQYIKNLDEIPFPARDLLPMQTYKAPISLGSPGRPFTSVLATRGCPFKCHYCSLTAMWGNQRRRSVENVLDELEELQEKYGIKYVSFVDDLLVVNKKWAIALCQGMRERGINIEWDCCGRIGVMDEELLLEMKKANCRCVIYGIEFGSQKILDWIQRCYTIQQVIDTVEMTAKAKIPIKGLFMMGYPTETKETLQETISLAKKLKLDYVTLSIVAPYSGTKLYEYCKENNVLCDMDQKGKDVLQLRYKAIALEHLTVDDLINYYKKFYFAYIMRPSYIWLMLTRHPQKVLAFGPRFLKWLFLGKWENS